MVKVLLKVKEGVRVLNKGQGVKEVVKVLKKWLTY